VHRGLQGLNLPNYLIKRVASDVHNEIPSVQNFYTLSPIPHFRSWLLRKKKETNHELLNPEEQTNLAKYGRSFWEILESDWTNDAELNRALQGPLTRWCKHYLLHEKHHGYAVDPVCNFHLKNGASIYRLNWLGDVSPQRMHESFGMMVNYKYDLNSTEQNSRKYKMEKKIQVSELLALPESKL
jgi:hypothetical protein